jgi:mRNA interferase MazF
MGAFVAGDVVVANFPFSDLSAIKRRPCLVLATLGGDDVVLCQITSQVASTPYAIPLLDADFIEGGLRHPSLIRPTRLFTASSARIFYHAGRISAAKHAEVLAALIALFQTQHP